MRERYYVDEAILDAMNALVHPASSWFSIFAASCTLITHVPIFILWRVFIAPSERDLEELAQGPDDEDGPYASPPDVEGWPRHR